MRRVLFPVVFVWMLAEIAGFVLVGGAIGVFPTLGLVLLAIVAGVALTRRQGFGVLARMREAMAHGGNPGREVAHGLMILGAGILLLVPGFFSDAFGILLFVPPVRDAMWRRFGGGLRTMGAFASGPGRFARFKTRTSRPILDLDREDYSSSPDSTSPWTKPPAK